MEPLLGLFYLSVPLRTCGRQESVPRVFRETSGNLDKLEEIFVERHLLGFIPAEEVPRFHPETLGEFLDCAEVRLRIPPREVAVDRVPA